MMMDNLASYKCSVQNPVSLVPIEWAGCINDERYIDVLKQQMITAKLHSALVDYGFVEESMCLTGHHQINLKNTQQRRP